MQAVVLAGGEGTRLRPLTLTRPKPAITLVDRPFIRFMVDWLGTHGVEQVVMACGFRAEDLRSALVDSVAGGPEVAYLEEGEPLGTAGPVRLAADQGLLDDRFLVLNGDVLTDLDLTAHVAAHTEREAMASLALYAAGDPAAYGLVKLGGDGAVREFSEKPAPAGTGRAAAASGAAGGGGDGGICLVNAGAYVLERSVADLIPPGRAVSIEREIFPRLVRQGLYGLPLEGYWMDIGTPERYLRASWDILAGSVRTGVGSRVDSRAIAVDEHADVDGRATVEGPALVDSGAMVAEQAAIGPRAVVGRDCEVGAGSLVAGSVLQAGCRVGAGARVEGSILAEGVEVGEDAIVGEGSVIGEGARIEPGSKLKPESRIEPGGLA